MTRQEFGQLELSDVSFLLREIEKEDERKQLRDANFLCALLAPHRDPKKPPPKPQDFMPKEEKSMEAKMRERLMQIKKTVS